RGRGCAASRRHSTRAATCRREPAWAGSVMARDAMSWPLRDQISLDTGKCPHHPGHVVVAIDFHNGVALPTLMVTRAFGRRWRRVACGVIDSAIFPKDQVGAEPPLGDDDVIVATCEQIVGNGHRTNVSVHDIDDERTLTIGSHVEGVMKQPEVST